MAIIAPVSRYKINTYIILFFGCLAMGGWFYYDGYHNQKFITEHTNPDGTPNDTLVFNQKAWPYLIGAAVVVAGLFVMNRGRKVVADDKVLVIGSRTIPYDSIQKINKTNFDTKGFFIITFQGSSGNETDLKLSSRTYDNLSAVLDRLIEAISGPVPKEGQGSS